MMNTIMLTDDQVIEDNHQNANRSKNEKSNSHHDHNLHRDHQHHDHQHHDDDIDVNIDYNHASLLTTLNRTLSITEPLLQRISKSIYSNIIIIGIAGGSGSGKTTLTKAIYESIGN